MSDSVIEQSALVGSMPLLTGKPKNLEDFSGQVVLVVNTASACGFTPQYQGLELLFQKYKDQGFTVLAFPCNQFGRQESGNDSEIQQFCQKNYGVSFPVFSKIDVNGDQAAPLFKQLKSAAPGIMGTAAIKWNFTKFLLGRDGDVIGRYAPATKPEALMADIEEALTADVE